MLCKTVRPAAWLGVVVLVSCAVAGGVWTRHVDAGEEGERAGDSSTQVLLLGTQFRSLDRPDPRRISGCLHREIVRQGLLIAARDELGLPTRDQTLQETFVDEKGRELVPLEVSSDASLDKVLKARLSRVEGEKEQEIWQAEYGFPLKSYFVYLALLEQVEADSRTGMVEALRKAGYGVASRVGQANASEDAAPTKVPEKVEQWLSVMSFAPQFAAVRWAHQTSREKGQSPALLGVLVRGYANLGMLTEYYYNSMSRAFKARSLLYAERMVVAYPDSSEALWHRAYARAIVGMHGGALSQLEEIAEKFGQEKPPVDRLPGCMKLIEPCCRYDGQGLLAVAAEDESLLPLGHFLDFRVALAVNDTRLMVTATQEALKHCPDAYEIYSAFATKPALSMQRWAARAAPMAMARYLPARLGAVESLPASVTRLLKGGQPGLLSRLFGGAEAAEGPAPTSQQLAVALVAAGRVGADAGEPSWTVLGRMIQEVNFLQCVQILHDLRNAVRTPLADVVDQLRPLVEGHPYAAYVESFRVERDKEPEEYAEILKELQIVEPQFHMYGWFARIWNVETREVKQLGWAAVAASSSDFTAYSQTARQRYPGWSNSADRYRRMMVREFKEVSPHCPEALRTEINLTKDPSEKQLSQWEKKAERFPGCLRMIGHIYMTQDKYQGAVRCFEKSTAISPSLSGYFALADAYETQGKPELWQPTVEKYLKVEDFGLGHARAYSAIARRLMDQQKWEEAKPHALEAAGTYSAWGMECASRCYEGLGDWEQSELWARQESESYSRYSRIAWYFWCRRNGRGDLEAARRLAREFIESPYVASGSTGNLYAGRYYLLEGDRRKAIELWHEHFQDNPYLEICASVLVLAVELGDKAVQDEVCEALAKRHIIQDSTTPAVRVRFAQILEKTLRSREPLEPDLKAMAKVVEDTPLRQRPNVCYILGRLLELRGNPQKANEYYRQALTTRQVGLYSCTLAGHTLQGKSEADAGKPGRRK